MSSVLAWGVLAVLMAPASGAPATAPTTGPAFATPAAAPAPVVAPTPTPVVAPVVVPAPVVDGSTAWPNPTQLLGAGRLLEAALEYEEAWRTSGRPQDLTGAAGARAAMGHNGHAASYLRELVKRGQADAATATKIAELERGLVPVKIIIKTPERARDLVVRVTHRGRAADARPDLVYRTGMTRGREAEVSALLDAGTWEVWVEDAYYVEGRQHVTVAAAAAPVVTLDLVPRDPPLVHARRMASPGLLLGVGVGLMIGGTVEIKRVQRRSDVECGASGWPCRDLMSRGVSLRSAGAGLLGASAGMAAAHLVLLSHKRRVRRAVWAAEAGLGLVGVVAGAVGVGLSARHYNDLDRMGLWSDAEFQAAMHRNTTGHTVGAFFLGFGAGLLVRSLGYLAGTRGVLGRARRNRQERKGPFAFSPGGAGGLISASF